MYLIRNIHFGTNVTKNSNSMMEGGYFFYSVYVITGINIFRVPVPVSKESETLVGMAYLPWKHTAEVIEAV